MSANGATNKAAAKQGLFDRAVRELRDKIVNGALPPDQNVSEAAAAEMIGISRTPTREAMAHLVEEGLLERTPTGRWTVRRVTHEDIVDAIELRGVLEGTVVRLAAERGAVPEHLDACRSINAALDDVMDSDADSLEFDRYAELNAEFHRHLIKLAGSAILEREVERAYRMPLASPNAFLQNQMSVPEVRRSLFVSHTQHNAIIDAVERRESARAEALAREHARLARNNFDYVMTDKRGMAQAIPELSMIAAGPTRRQNRKSHQGRTL